jgi:hypothetical protein
LINEYDYKYYDDWCGGENPRATFGDGTGIFYGYKGSYLEGWTINHADYEDHEWETESKYSFVDLEEYEKDYRDYEIETNEETPWTASIVKYNGNKKELKVPAYIDGNGSPKSGTGHFNLVWALPVLRFRIALKYWDLICLALIQAAKV